MMSEVRISLEHNSSVMAAESPAQTFRWMLNLAERNWIAGRSQIAADTLAFLLLRSGLPLTLREEAEALFAELESRICPRAMLDARDFAADMDAQTMIEYLLDRD